MKSLAFHYENFQQYLSKIAALILTLKATILLNFFGFWNSKIHKFGDFYLKQNLYKSKSK